MSDDTNYERWRQLYQKVQGMQVQIDELKAPQTNPVPFADAVEHLYGSDMRQVLDKIRREESSSSPPQTELEQMQAELKQWEKWYPFTQDDRKLKVYTDHDWRVWGNIYRVKLLDNCRIILAAILAVELERAGKIGWLVSQRLGGNYYFFENRIGTSRNTEGQPTLLAALLALRERKEKGGA